MSMTRAGRAKSPGRVGKDGRVGRVGTGLDPEEGGSTLELLRAVQRGEVSALTLGKEARRACVECLLAEGYSAAETAQVLKISDRTVARDRREVRAAHALERDPSLAPEMAGRLMVEAEASVARLRRTARDRSTPAATRVEAERAAWHVTRDLVRLLQRLGWLPETAREVRADVRHSAGPPAPPAALEEVEAELRRLAAIGAACGQGEIASGVLERALALGPSHGTAPAPAPPREQRRRNTSAPRKKWVENERAEPRAPSGGARATPRPGKQQSGTQQPGTQQQGSISHETTGP